MKFQSSVATEFVPVGNDWYVNEQFNTALTVCYMCKWMPANGDIASIYYSWFISWVDLAQDTERWWAHVNVVINHRVP